MVDIRRKNIRVRIERREYPRLEFHCPVMIGGVKKIQKLTDLSIGGCFIEVDGPIEAEVGEVVELTINLPTEYDPLRVKANISSKIQRGIGCMFIDLTEEQVEAVTLCFETFKDTLPI